MQGDVVCQEVSKVADKGCALSTSELLSLGHGEQTELSIWLGTRCLHTTDVWGSEHSLKDLTHSKPRISPRAR